MPSPRPRVPAPSLPRRLAASLVLLVLALGAARPAARPAATPATPPPHVSSLTHEPGYRPLVDPESASVALGRRAGAPLVSMPFTGGAKSLDELGRQVCGALHAGSRDSLLRLCITETEFRTILWPEFPQSRPATGLTWVDGWRILFARLHAGCSQAVRDNGGHWYEFQRFESDSITTYRNFRLHGGLVLVAKDDMGGVQRWRWLRAVAERKGTFKIYSTDD